MDDSHAARQLKLPRLPWSDSAGNTTPPASAAPAFTTEQVMALAADAAAARAARSLASPGRWSGLAHGGGAAWGECQGSAAEPYQVRVDLNGPTFKCSCPSRKLPCKHSLALLLLYVESPSAFEANSPLPAWVAEWMAGRARRAAPPANAAPPARPEGDSGSKARRQAQREARVAAGLDEFDLWLRDLVRRGLGAAPEQPARFWETAAARLVDAQAPGLAREVRALASLPALGHGWQGLLAERLGRLHLAVEGYRRLDSLPEAARADVRAVVGWTTPQEDVLAGAGVRDRWLVLGQHIETEEHLRVMRTWLWAEAAHRPALLLDFAVTGQGFENVLTPGTALEAELTFFPSAYPLRALVRARQAAQPLTHLPGYATLDEAAAAYGAALACCPWLERFPVPLEAVLPVKVDDGWWLRDSAGAGWPLTPRFAGGWTLLALSGGRPLGVFGEWDGHHLLPLSAFADGRLAPLVEVTP